MTNFKKLQLRKSIIAIIFISVVIASCKKESTNMPPQSNEKLSTTNDVGLPPPIIGWGRGPNIPITDGFNLTDASAAFAFTINGKGYIGGGFGNGATLHETWQYDPLTKSWSRVADFPGHNNLATACFVIGNYAYVCTGGLAGSSETWQYNPLTNVWTPKATFPGTIRLSAVGIALNGKGYVGLGINNFQVGGQDNRDWWEYDPVTDSWTQKANFPGTKRNAAVAFAINGKGYVATGHHTNPNTGVENFYNDLWQYNPVNDTWTQKADLPAQGRYQAVGLTAFSNKGIVATGRPSTGPFLNDCWEYIPSSNSWAQLPNVGGGPRAGAAGFAIGNTLYIGTSATGNNLQIADFWGLTINP